jgi:hypothetical protein
MMSWQATGSGNWRERRRTGNCGEFVFARFDLAAGREQHRAETAANSASEFHKSLEFRGDPGRKREGVFAPCNQTNWFAIHVILTAKVRQSTLRSF